MSPSRVHPQQALAIYAEPLAVRRRVVVFGEEESVSERLVELGARQVVTLRPGDDDADLRPASFDLALVLDLGLFEEPDRLLSRVRRLVGEGGAALVSAANRDVVTASGRRAFDYYELFDLVAREFGEVRMVAQLGFHGVALAELGTDDESPAVSVDTQLVDEQRAPESFIALGSQRGVQHDP
jgi:SAM-dependent methyltransferase